MITEDDIEIYVGKDSIRATLRLSIEKHYGLRGINERDHHKIQWTIANQLKQDIMRKVYDKAPTPC